MNSVGAVSKLCDAFYCTPVFILREHFPYKIYGAPGKCYCLPSTKPIKNDKQTIKCHFNDVDDENSRPVYSIVSSKTPPHIAIVTRIKISHTKRHRPSANRNN